MNKYNHAADKRRLLVVSLPVYCDEVGASVDILTAQTLLPKTPESEGLLNIFLLSFCYAAMPDFY